MWPLRSYATPTSCGRVLRVLFPRVLCAFLPVSGSTVEKFFGFLGCEFLSLRLISILSCSLRLISIRVNRCDAQTNSAGMQTVLFLPFEVCVEHCLGHVDYAPLVPARRLHLAPESKHFPGSLWTVVFNVLCTEPVFFCALQ